MLILMVVVHLTILLDGGDAWRQIRDECVVMKGEEGCQAEIEAHKVKSIVIIIISAYGPPRDPYITDYF